MYNAQPMSEQLQPVPSADLTPTHRYISFPAIVDSLRDFKGRLLEVGFGRGDLAVVLARRGIDVTAIDSRPLAAHFATVRNPDTTAKFEQADIVDFHASESFDAAVSTAVLHCSTSQEQLQNVLRGVAENLKRGAAFTSVFLHPDFQSDQDRMIAGRLFRRVDDQRVQIESVLEEGVIVRSPVITLFTKCQYEKSALEAGFSSCEWKDLFPNTEGRQVCDDELWGSAATKALYAMLTLRK